MSVSLKIANTERSDVVLWGSLKRDNRINNDPDKLTFKMKEGGSQPYKPQIGDEVILEVNGTREFGGVIVRVEEQMTSAFQIEHKVVCDDWVYKLNGQLVTERYENTDVQAVINDVVTNHTSGFTTNEVKGSGISVDSVAFNRLSVAQVLEKLSNLTSYFWYVDYNKDIHFAPKQENEAPFKLTDDTSDSDYGKFVYKSLVKQGDITQIKNKILVEGGEKEGVQRTVTRDGSEVSTEGTLNLEYKFAEKPTVKVNSTTQTVGVDFLDDDTSFDVMWSFQQKYLRFTSGNIPTGGDTIEIIGNPLFPIIVEVPDVQSIGEFGLKEYAIKDRTIRSEDEAIERASAELRTYADTIVEGKFETRTPGLRAGQVMTISDSFRNIDEDVLLQRVQLIPTDPNGDVFLYKVQYATLKSIGIIEFLQNQILDEELEKNEDEVLLSYIQVPGFGAFDTANFTDTLQTPTTSSPPYKYSNDAGTTPNAGVYNFSTYA